MRKVQNFNDQWLFLKKDEVYASLPQEGENITLPHSWNAKDGQDGGNDYYRGTCAYVKEFTRPKGEEKNILEFDGVFHTAEVYLNGLRICTHEGGYSRFRVELKDLQDENVLCVLVSNEKSERVYPQKADFTFYGGIYRDVKLISVPERHFELIKDGTPGIKVTPCVEGRNGKVLVETWQNGDGTVRFTIGDCVKEAGSRNGHAEALFEFEEVHLWDGLQDPYLYEVKAEYEGDEVSTRFGFRTMEVDPQKGFLLNGRPYPLRGVSRHQDRWQMGNAITLKEHREDMDMIREIGANSIRLAHYQHAQEFYDLCDEAGMVVWAEIPYITLHMNGGRENTLAQMRELITQCYNHPSIAVWGLSNEITASGSITEDLMENHRLLQDLCKRMDPNRYTVMAHAFMLETDSELISIADLASYNLYFGWYLGELKENDEFFDEYHTKFPNRAIGLSEYGADANIQYHSSHPQRGDYSEEYQCVYHEHILKMIAERPYLWCTCVWNMFDFGADGRNEGGRNGQNQKGLVSIDRKIRKDAFYLYKAFWSKEPFVHVCGRRYVNRAEEKTTVKVYTNLNEISLYVDDQLVETKKGDKIFTFEVGICGRHHIKAVSGSFCDEIEVVKTEKADPEYQLLDNEIVNWFEKEEIDPDYYSIKDTFGALMSHPASAAIVGRIMEAAKASRGEVAEASSNNANLQKMLAKMTFESLLKQAGPAIKPEMIRSLNEALQKIRKVQK